MELRKGIVLKIVCFFGIVVCSGELFFYTATNGIPWEKARYEKKVDDYLKTKYPTIEFTLRGVSYSKIDSNFYSSWAADSGVLINVAPTYENGFQDNYLATSKGFDVSNEINSFVQKNFNEYSTAELLIEAREDLLNKYGDDVLYSDMGKEIHSLSKIHIRLHADFSESEEEVSKYLKIIHWIKVKKYEATTVLFFKSQPQIIIHYDDLAKLETWEDLKKFY
ncbi:hypothetical protein ACFFSY_20265 [Paenibacillus aurantiacus]|uniref:Uncharacterized protein n=1 Tax=Paenibacillus aurantiacus TaxID=1936118 RepID=A0ABV5KUM2_9BACL